MGYATTFDGRFNLDKPLAAEHSLFLHKFAGTRRVKRVVSITADRADPARKAVGLPVGIEGAYFVGAGGRFGGDDSVGVVDLNEPPDGQPSIYCQWVPTFDNASIKWDDYPNFERPGEWIGYLIDHFLKPFGYILNGEVEWAGEDHGDLGKIVVEDNVVQVLEGRIVYG